MAYLYMSQSQNQKAFELFDACKVYTLAIQCLEKLDDLEQKALFYAKKGQSQEALTWFYKMQEEIVVKAKFKHDDPQVIEIQEKIERLIQEPQSFVEKKRIPQTVDIINENNTFKL